MTKELLEYKRPSYMAIGQIYFWTATIHNWQKLLVEDKYKDIIIASLKYLAQTGKIDVFGFVIMPNHVHLIWRMNELNGKEKANGSFLKFTAHEFKRILVQEEITTLSLFKVDAKNKQYEFWQRDSMAIPLLSKEVALQKLNYIHNNPLNERWNLAEASCDYKYSSAGYYERDANRFEFLKDLMGEF